MMQKHLPTHQVLSFLCTDCDEDKLKHAPVDKHEAANLQCLKYENIEKCAGKIVGQSDHPNVEEGDIGDSGNTLPNSA